MKERKLKAARACPSITHQPCLFCLHSQEQPCKVLPDHTHVGPSARTRQIDGPHAPINVRSHETRQPYRHGKWGGGGEMEKKRKKWKTGLAGGVGPTGIYGSLMDVPLAAKGTSIDTDPMRWDPPTPPTVSVFGSGREIRTTLIKFQPGPWMAFFSLVVSIFFPFNCSKGEPMVDYRNVRVNSDTSDCLMQKFMTTLGWEILPGNWLCLGRRPIKSVV